MTRWLGLTVFLLGAVVAVAATSFLPVETAEAYLGENGPIELATAYLWFTLALVLFVLAAGRHALFFTGFVSALAGARELDAHSAFTDDAVTNLRYWTRDTASVSEKILVAIILALILAVLVIAIRRYWRDVAKSLAAGHGWTWSFATMVLATPVLMLADGTARYYRDLTGGLLDPATHVLSIAFEEVGELMLPVIGFVALGQYFEQAAAAGPRSAQVPEEPGAT